MIEYNIHPAANTFPMMDKDRYSDLLNDIKSNGQLEEITICENMILDGRNRYKACKELGLEPKIKIFDGNPWSYTWSLNGQRRDLNAEQRYLIWAECNKHSAEWVEKQRTVQEEANRSRSEYAIDRNRDRDGLFEPVVGLTDPPLDKQHITRELKATASNTNTGAVKRGDKLLKDRPDLAKQVMMGKITASKAHSIIKQEEIKQIKNDIDNNTMILPEGLFEVINIDPPWNYGTQYSSDGRRVASPYPEMTQQELLNINLPAAENCILFLWTTHKFIWDAKELLDNWGFNYRCMLVWDKDKMGMGDLFRMQCEFCLVGIKGKPLFDNDFTNRDIIREPRREHSRKPDAFYDMVNKLCVGRKLDYFSRENRGGWYTYGAETNKFMAE